MLTIIPWLRIFTLDCSIPGLKKNQFSTTLQPQNADSNAYFSNQEKIDLSIALDNFRKTVIQHFDLQDHKVKLLDSQVKLLAANSDKISKKDWLLLAYGSLVSLAQTLALDPQQGISNRRFRQCVQAYENDIVISLVFLVKSIQLIHRITNLPFTLNKFIYTYGLATARQTIRMKVVYIKG